MGGGCDTPPLGGLSFAAHRWVPQTGWFFMSLFLAILELSWTGRFWIFFWKFRKFLRRQIFPKSIQRGDPSIEKSKKSKKAFFFLLQIIFFLPKYEFYMFSAFIWGIKHVCSSKFFNFCYFCQFWLKSLVVQNFWNFWKIFKKWHYLNLSNAWNDDAMKNKSIWGVHWWVTSNNLLGGCITPPHVIRYREKPM